MNDSVVASWKNPELRYKAKVGVGTVTKEHPAGDPNAPLDPTANNEHVYGGESEAMTTMSCDCKGFTNGIKACWRAIMSGTAMPSCLC
jgi:hypothetical protein